MKKLAYSKNVFVSLLFFESSSVVYYTFNQVWGNGQFEALHKHKHFVSKGRKINLKSL